MRQYLREILDLLGEDRRKLPWLILLFFGSSLLDFIGVGLVGAYVALIALMALPHAPGGVVGKVMAMLPLPGDRHQSLVLVGMLLLAIFVAKGIAAVSIHRTVVHFSRDQQVRLQSMLMHSYQRLAYTHFLDRNISEYAYAIGGLTMDFGIAVQIMLRMIGDCILAVVMLALLAAQNAQAVTLLLALLVATVYGYDRLFRRRLRGYGERANEAATAMWQGINEALAGFKEIRILGKEAHFHRAVQAAATDLSRYHTILQVTSVVPRYVVEVVMVAFVVSLVLASIAMGGDPTALVPTLTMFGVAGLRLMPAASSLSNSLLQLRYHRASVSQLHRDVRDLAGSPLVDDAAPNRAPPQPFQSIVLDGVRFTYPAATGAALQSLSMEVRAGDSIGLIGSSGAGKTTLVDVLLGLLEPQEGELRYNGRPLKEALAQWRAQVAYLPQEVFLTAGTLRENVALGLDRAEIDDARVHEALSQARLSELVAQLPQGLDTAIGEHGARLSGGQRQRVAIARAFYHGRNVLVMDEATSALDMETEAEIVEEIRRLKGLKTLIVIAHRLSTVRHCDLILRLKDGRIAQQGSYDQVVLGDAS